MADHADRRVCVTGIGMVTPLGVGKGRFWEALRSGEKGIREIAAFPTVGLGSHLGAEVHDFQPRDFVTLKNLRKMDRLSAMTTASVRMALEDAGITVSPANRDRIGIVMGTAFGNTEQKVQSARILFTEGPGMVNPIHVPNTVMNAPAGHASIELGFRGVNTTVNHLAVSAEAAIAYASMEIRRGAADVILAGGADILSPFFYEALCRFRSLSPVDGGVEGARPFDMARNGPVMGEGCGIVCLEAGESVVGRGAASYCEISGWGMASAPSEPAGWSGDPRGFQLALERALRMAGAKAPEIDCIAAAGNGGGEPDAMEAQVYGRLFGGERPGPLITTLKGATGEIFASGGIRAAALTLAIRAGVVPPTAGLLRPISTLPFVIGTARQRMVGKALLSGISFGGTFVGLVFQK
ncbi:MAG: beta-ketoacyl-[acyl-carrier-protein] synthase family protein [Deltaproteobacteria bacterium]|nr:beta-ketoacyl-[acyl-carrier-protein] synthase family protein [Deltaproteobacteria bacterium]